MKHALWLIATLVPLGFVQAQSGQPLLTRSVVAGGGTTLSTSNRFQLSGTIGQPAAETLDGNRFSIRQGFWHWRAPVLLPAGHTGTNILFSLQTEVGKTYLIQYSTSPTGPNWQTISTLAGDGSLRTVTNAIPSSAGFFRVVEQ